MEIVDSVPPKRIYFLELIRTLAALYVFVYHVAQRITINSSLIKTALSFGQEAVMIFFVLSGFVIYYSQLLKKDGFTLRSYLKARIMRIYPVFVFALIVAYITMCLIKEYLVPIDALNFLENIFMLQDFSSGKPGILIKPYMGNTPLWSLSYEWWFYMMFIPFFFIKKQYQMPLVFLLSALALIGYLIHPNQICLWITYFALWWFGVEAAKKYLLQNNANKIWPIIYGLILILMLVGYTLFIYEGKLEFGLFPILFIRHFFMALLFYIFLVYVNVHKFKISERNILVKLAPYSYAFYVVHYPVLNLFDAKKWLDYSNWFVIILLAIVVLITWFAEEIIHNNICKYVRSK